MRLTKISIVFVLYSVATASQARGAVITMQALQPAFVGEFSNLGPSNQQAADDFHLTGMTALDSFSWFGRYFADIPVANPVDFSIRIFADDAGKPAVLPLHALNGSFNAVPTGLTFGGIPWFSYSTPIAVVLNAGTYWISVVENDPDTPLFGGSQWLWGDSDTIGVRALRLSDGSPWVSGLDVDHAFTLTGTAIPEPSSLVLSVLGIVGLAGRLRRRGSADGRFTSAT